MISLINKTPPIKEGFQEGYLKGDRVIVQET